MSDGRSAALLALLRVDYDNGYSNLVLNQVLEKANLNKQDASLASMIFYGVLENRTRLDYVISCFVRQPIRKLSPDVLEILRMGVYQILYLDKVPISAAVNESVKLVKMRKKVRLSGFVNGVLRSIGRGVDQISEPDEQKDPALFLSVRYSCPVWLITLWEKAYGKQITGELLSSLSGRPLLFARVNTIKNSKEELLKKLEEEGVRAMPYEILPDAVELFESGSIGSLRAFQEGRFHIEDASSQILCQLLCVKPGQTVYDICSAPGGKAFTLAETMKNQGKIFAFDLYEARVRLIQEGAKRLGLSIIEAKVRDALEQNDGLGKADRVLCDVPCSGLGIIRRKPEIRYKDRMGLDSLPDLQYRILCNSQRFTKQGGILMYSTCTLNPAENGEIADRFLAEHSGYEAMELVLPNTVKRTIKEPSNQLTLMPQTNGTDGFFMAAFRRLR